MTRQELIKITEDHVREIESDLAVSKQALSLLKNGIYMPEAAHKLKNLRNGPIVYGNGHHDGKKPRRSWRSKSGTNSLAHSATLQARSKIEQMLREHPEGVTTKQMSEAVTKAGIEITDHTIHNALRALKAIKLQGGSGSRFTTYTLSGSGQ